jgi:oligopeptide/dipeptide ABC transporter ATP-binding protein
VIRTAQRSAPAGPLLEIDGLEVAFPALAGAAENGWVPAVRGVSLTVERGEIVGLVGESGSGKSLTALALLRLLPPAARLRGSARLDGEDLLALPEPALRRVRGGRIAIVFQEPMTAFNPVYTVGFQIAEAVRAHRKVRRREALDEAARLLDLVAVPDARRRLGDYPHQLSGGQRQRAMIAMALAGGPDLLLADEPTTALDVTIQAQILELLERLRAELGLAVLLITHDLGVIAQTCDRVAVMYAGQVVEEADVHTLFRAPAHPYTRGLLATLPRLGSPVPRGRLPVLAGSQPDPAHRPAGCAFRPRCSEALEVCGRKEPELIAVGTAGQQARCFLHALDSGEAP